MTVRLLLYPAQHHSCSTSVANNNKYIQQEGIGVYNNVTYHDWNTPERHQSDQQRHHRDDPRELLLVVRSSSNPQHVFFRLLSSILNIFGIVVCGLFYVLFVSYPFMLLLCSFQKKDFMDSLWARAPLCLFLALSDANIL